MMLVCYDKFKGLPTRGDKRNVSEGIAATEVTLSFELHGPIGV